MIVMEWLGKFGTFGKAVALILLLLTVVSFSLLNRLLKRN